MNINENFKNKVKMIKKKLCHLFVASNYPRPMSMVTNVSLGSGLSSDVSHMQIIRLYINEY